MGASMMIVLHLNPIYIQVEWSEYRIITAYFPLRVSCDKIMQLRWNFDASNARNQKVSALDKHQNWSESALFLKYTTHQNNDIPSAENQQHFNDVFTIPWCLNLKGKSEKSTYRHMTASTFGNKFIIKAYDTKFSL